MQLKAKHVDKRADTRLNQLYIFFSRNKRVELTRTNNLRGYDQLCIKCFGYHSPFVFVPAFLIYPLLWPMRTVQRKWNWTKEGRSILFNRPTLIWSEAKEKLVILATVLTLNFRDQAFKSWRRLLAKRRKKISKLALDPFWWSCVRLHVVFFFGWVAKRTPCNVYLALLQLRK